MNWYDFAWQAFALFGAVVFTYYTARHGIGWVVDKVKSAAAHAKVDVLDLEARIKALEEQFKAPKPAA
jgi:hypothetical protein